MSTSKRIIFRRSRRSESLQLQFGSRVLAFIIDLIVVRTLLFPVILFIPEAGAGWQTNLLALIVYWLYSAILEGSVGATLGKYFVRLRINNSDGSKLTLAKAIFRFPLKVISIISLLGVLMIDVNKEKQGLHDLVCRTIVRER